MSDYSYSHSSVFRSACNCECQEEIALLQKKLTEVHAKLLQQIDLCRDQEAEIISIHRTHQASPHRAYDTFGRKSRNKQNVGPNESREGTLIKNELLQADLEAMRHRVLTEITQKNRLLEEMGDLKKRHRKELANEVKKFEGLQILYRKMAADKGIRLQQNWGQVGEVEALKKIVSELEAKLREERERSRRINAENKQFRESIEQLNEEVMKLRCYDRQRSQNSDESTGQLKEIDSLKQQMSRINRNISLRELEFTRQSQQRRKRIEEEQESLRGDTKLVGESRWGRRHIS